MTQNPPHGPGHQNSQQQWPAPDGVAPYGDDAHQPRQHGDPAPDPNQQAGPGPQQYGAPAGFVPPATGPTGDLAWMMGFLALICIPFVGQLGAAIAMVVAGRSQRTKGPLAAQNGVNAANLGATYGLLTVVAAVTHFGLLFAIPDGSDVKKGFFPIGIPLTIWGLLSVAFLVCSILGLVKAGKREVFRAPAIRFFKG